MLTVHTNFIQNKNKIITKLFLISILFFVVSIELEASAGTKPFSMRKKSVKLYQIKQTIKQDFGDKKSKYERRPKKKLIYYVIITVKIRFKKNLKKKKTNFFIIFIDNVIMFLNLKLPLDLKYASFELKVYSIS
ncbi:hypothetical protein BpHYR1_034719 [Brachionus plicatilis]|uniref:Uncharacterized protein n=1 Tax=Brachionus plicatilis TaxID=10195 RepID=A0A3M7QL51_BRAPC|nr:hypothetical protein BpHYR1_034719 [Brachionus plicatilis]